jgi:hypothetical protein
MFLTGFMVGFITAFISSFLLSVFIMSLLRFTSQIPKESKRNLYFWENTSKENK